MTPFDTVLAVDWSAAKRKPRRPSKDAIWLGVARGGIAEQPVYCRSRIEAEAWISRFLAAEQAAGRRVLAAFDFPFGYPRGLARRITGSNDPFALWAWLEERIEDAQNGNNNRFDVASEMNRQFAGAGPFWGKPDEKAWPDIPYRKVGLRYEDVAERRRADLAAKASSSCFQLFFNPTVGSQVLMGLPVLQRLRLRHMVAVWPFQNIADAQIVFAEIWPGLIEPAVKAAMAVAGRDEIRDRVQMRLLSQALSRLPAQELAAMLAAAPDEAQEEAWILGTGFEDRLNALASEDPGGLTPPPLSNDCFALPAGVDWTPVDDALALLRDRLGPVTGAETVPLADALGRVLAADAAAKRSNPPLPNTAVDGYGFAGGRAAGPHVLPLVQGRAAAGVPFDGTVAEGNAIRVLTGAALPEGVDTVILEEDVNTDGEQIAFNGPLKQGANTRKAGEDVCADEVILPAGRVITPADLALASATGLAELTVRLPLRVGVLSTGDELVEAGEPAGKGQIFDANRPMLLALIRQLGFVPVDLGKAADDREALRRHLDSAAAKTDVILTSGGASAGDEDHMSALLREAGAMQEWRIALKPGRPLALGMWQGTPVFGLPGNPVAALVCTLIFARPAMGLMAGAGWQEPQAFEVPAAFEKRKKPGRREYLRARVRDGKAEVFKSEGSGRISGLSWAEGLVELGDGAAEIKPGDPVRFIPYGSFAMQA
ncbi:MULTISPECIES: molybdopterin-binding protein [unclassified Leisingera]|uniref:molybdopterin-binding protein n=1 Tax=unclassified Leisingera TaxID=2614906 RepID=UPI0002F26843|nr:MULTISPECIES: gephyrin-like molybdotransferase Glp [unclassified Leisingera]KIC24603.1 molybdopterin biosynthesis protein MoeA [Leisingera sp. ANG-S3]KIC55541.1 molybdopterin biosynthesis protein MoeA [Leisingera sp. ANG-S]KID09273.1 molybdopterin biosynthesis protein MoeA [Leisingera sp. ANG1]